MTPTTWLTFAHQFQQSQQPYALVTVLRVTPPTSSRPGDKAVVTPDGTIHGWIGGGCAQPAVIKTVRAALADGVPRTIRISPSDEGTEQLLGDVLAFGMTCHSGGTLELFIDPVLPLTELTVMGDSPVAHALCELAPRVGFSVRAVPSAFDQAPSGGWVIVATQGRGDLPALRAALEAQARTVWFVASERKGNVLKDSLKASGLPTAAVDAIVAPAGTPIGAQTPEEIALSVLGAVIAARRQAPASHASAQPIEALAAMSAAPMEAAPKASCCGGAKAAPVLEPVPAVASAGKGSCCGGGA
jgi:xanthine dehydrogenase accessory factor